MKTAAPIFLTFVVHFARCPCMHAGHTRSLLSFMILISIALCTLWPLQQSLHCMYVTSSSVFLCATHFCSKRLHSSTLTRYHDTHLTKRHSLNSANTSHAGGMTLALLCNLIITSVQALGQTLVKTVSCKCTLQILLKWKRCCNYCM